MKVKVLGKLIESTGKLPGKNQELRGKHPESTMKFHEDNQDLQELQYKYKRESRAKIQDM